MVASLTRAAAHEFQSRGLGIIPTEQLGTLHHICLAALGGPELTERYRAQWRDYALEKGGVDFPLSAKAGRHGDFLEENTDADKLLNELTVLRNTRPGILNRVDPETLMHGKLLLFHRLWEDWKDENQYVDFTDLLEQCLEHVDRAPGNPAAMYGDEAQDWSKLEVELFRDKWGQHAEQVYLVGDEDQTIYVWRGADPRIFIDHPVPENQKILLDQSYRVPGDVRDCALAWIKFKIPDRTQVEYKSRAERGCVSRVRAGYRNPEGLKPILEEIQAGEETCMILASCSYMLRPTIKMLRNMGLPYGNPYRSEFGGWNPLRLGGPGQFGKEPEVTKLDRLLTYLTGSRELRGDRTREWTWKDIQMWCEPLRAQGKDAVLIHGSKTRLNELVENAESFNLNVFSELFVGGWKGLHAERAFRVDLSWWVSSMLEKHINGYGYLVHLTQIHGQRILLDRPRLWPGTIHSVKGGEATNVILFPDISPAGSKLYWSPEGHRVVRLFYVAMTRAYRRLIICSPESTHHVEIYQTASKAEVIGDTTEEPLLTDDGFDIPF